MTLDRPCRWLGVGASLLVRYSSDGSRIGVASGRSVKVFNAATGAPVAITPWQHGNAVSFDFSPDGTTIAVASANGAYGPSGVQLWSLSTGALLRSLASPSPTSVAFSPDGQLLAVADSHMGNVMIVRAADGSTVTTIANSRALGAVGFSGDGKTFWMVGVNISFRYSVSGWTLLGQGIGGNQPVGSQALPGDFGDSRVHVTTDGQTAVFIGTVLDGPVPIGTEASAADISGDGTRTAYGTLDGHVVLYGPNNSFLRELTLDASPVRSAALSPSAATVTVVGDGGKVRTWNVADGTLVWSREGPASDARLLDAAIAGGRFAVEGQNGTGEASVWLLDGQTGAVTATFTPGPDVSPYGHAGWSALPDGRAIAYPTSHASVALLDPSGSETQLAAPAGITGFSGAQYSPGGTVLAGLGQGRASDSIVLWDTASRAVLRTLHGADALGFAFSPDGALVGSTGLGNPNLVVWDAASGATLASYFSGSPEVSTGSSNSVAFSHSRLWVATAVDAPTERGLLVWSLGADRATAHVYSVAAQPMGSVSPYPDSNLADVTFSPGDALLAADARDEGPVNGTIVFRFSDGAPLILVPGPSSGLAFLDDHTIARGEPDGTVTVWCLP